ncbi:T6SS immunity protein Tli4 family protein [Massilia aerilata]|uniref:T6SS immunity protein Tli4 family protein n=1 Tax=Massilia aerilata TaxID=453817 RepID=A0ABW0RWA1_9BURK
MHRRLQLAFLLAVLLCAGVWIASRVRSVHDRSKVAQFTKGMKIVCVGRYLVDVPAQANVSLSSEQLAGFEIQTLAEDEATFWARLAAREAEIATSGRPSDESNGLAKVRDLRIPGMIGRTMIFGRNTGYLMEPGRRVKDQFSSVEVHSHIGKQSFTLSAKYGDEGRARLAETLLARLRLRGEDEIPSEPGFCIERAFFSEPLPIREAEHFALQIGLPDHADVKMTLISLPGGGAEHGLFQRVAETDSKADFGERLRTTKLRLKKRSVDGLEGEEALESFIELNFATTYSFIWEARGIRGNPLRPFLSLELQAGMSQRAGGKPVDASLHQDALLALWDSIASSIRLRDPELGSLQRSNDPGRLKAVATTVPNKL